jgi:pimeloyl-ACP methyl ester carboxylesterase
VQGGSHRPAAMFNAGAITLPRGEMIATKPLQKASLSPGIRSGFVDGVNGLRMHILEAGLEEQDRPCLLLLHGFPELAYSWRKVMLPLADAGFHVIAPDQRGYGRTTGWDARYDGDVGSFSLLNIVRDALALVFALGHRSVVAVVGHDFGSPVAAYCGLVRPDVFRSVVLMSAPFAGPPALAINTVGQHQDNGAARPASTIHDQLAALDPPRKHYQWYYSTREANEEMHRCPQGVHAFLRAYYHHKSADWAGNKPFPLASWTASELAKLPPYYVMRLEKGMAETVASEMPTAAHIAACQWLPEEELKVYSTEYDRTGFQGGLQWYRCATGARYISELTLFSGRTIDVPSCFISGASDWGNHQMPGALQQMQTSACTHMVGCHLVEGAGHWVQQEQPQEVSRLLLQFLDQARSPP